MPNAALNTLKALFGASDEQAMWRVQMEDDPAAFAQLVRRWERPIQSLCTRMIGDGHRAEDLTQDVFARVFARRKHYQASGKFSTWLWRIALNCCYDELRKNQRRTWLPLSADDAPDEAGESAWEIDPVPAPDGAAEDNERAGIVRRAVLQLPEPLRSVVVLRHYEDLKFHEIAEVLGIPEGTVKSRMAEALIRLERGLRPKLDDREASPARPGPEPGKIESKIL